ncbi:hypothetical protein B0H10DRAFT_284737 [Mycena sp. CBHHK59/15]|nr:hypothetical protein B0H10DRAFT_284737 [Mycena sp. CBHHK59/15]
MSLTVDGSLDSKFINARECEPLTQQEMETTTVIVIPPCGHLRCIGRAASHALPTCAHRVDSVLDQSDPAESTIALRSQKSHTIKSWSQTLNRIFLVHHLGSGTRPASDFVLPFKQAATIRRHPLTWAARVRALTAWAEESTTGSLLVLVQEARNGPSIDGDLHADNNLVVGTACSAAFCNVFAILGLTGGDGGPARQIAKIVHGQGRVRALDLFNCHDVVEARRVRMHSSCHGRMSERNWTGENNGDNLGNEHDIDPAGFLRVRRHQVGRRVRRVLQIALQLQEVQARRHVYEG